MPVRIKPGVSIRGISPEMSVCIQVVEGFYARKGAGDLWITSCTEGKHRRGSLHYIGNAIDTRIWSIAERSRDQFARGGADDFSYFSSSPVETFPADRFLITLLIKVERRSKLEWGKEFINYHRELDLKVSNKHLNLL